MNKQNDYSDLIIYNMVDYLRIKQCVIDNPKN